MACSLSHTDSEIEALIQKLIDEDKGRQNAILNLALQFENSCTVKNDLRNAYEKCTDISQESRALIDSFLKEGDLYLIEKDLHQLHLYEKALRETLEEQAMDAKAREEKIRQKQADDDEFFLEFGWIIPDPAGIVQQAKLLKERDILLGWDGAVMLTQEYMQKVVEDADEDDDFNSGAWVSATNYVNAFSGTVTGCLGDVDNFLKMRKLEHVVAIVKSYSPNMFGDLNVTLKDLSGTIPETIHYKVLDVGSYEKDINVGAAMILANVIVFTPKLSHHYLNIIMRNVIEVFRKDTVFGSGSGFNLSTGSWGPCEADLPDELTFVRLASGNGNRLFMFGGIGTFGISTSMKVWELDPNGRNWNEIEMLEEELGIGCLNALLYPTIGVMVSSGFRLYPCSMVTFN
ncbi:transposase, MuDR, MULE transposase domain protein [Tanacetum coccineum]